MGSGGLSDAEIEKMVQQAEDMRDADTKKKELVTVRNDAETLAYQFEKQTTELKDKMSTADADELKAKVADIRQYMASDDVDPEELKRKTTELQEKSWKVTQEAYQQGAAEDGAAGDGGGEQASKGEKEKK